MKIDTFFTPLGLTPADTQGRTVVVIDVLRATSSIAVALHHGAKAIVPVASAEEGLRVAQNLERETVVLAGERKSVRIPGFALGNSPLEFTAEVVQGKTVVLTTSNGTGALVGVQGAREVLTMAAVNFTTVVNHCRLVMAQHGDLVILCAGSERRFSLEDAFAAGRLAKVLLPEGGLRNVRVNDAGIAALEIARHYGEKWLRALRASAHGQELADLGFREDVKACAVENTHPVLPVYAERRIIAHREPAQG